MDDGRFPSKRLLRRYRILLTRQRRMHGMPSQGGTLDSNRKLRDAGKNRQLTKFTGTAVRGSLPSNQPVKAIKNLFRFDSAFAFQGLRHHGRRCLGDGATGTLKSDVANGIAFKFEIHGEVVSAKGIEAFRLLRRIRQLAVVPRLLAVLQNNFLVEVT